jgi:hypothetical protein
VIALVRAMASEWEQKGDMIAGVSRSGQSFTIHMEHGRGLRPDQLSRALRYMDVTREEFDEWRRG